MAKNRSLGIHYDQAHLTAVVLEKHGSDFHWASTIKLAANGSAGAAAPEDLPRQLAEQVHQQYPRTLPVMLALAGRFYQTQMHHTEFTETRQIKQTLHFDVEEELAADAENLALCYCPCPPVGGGSAAGSGSDLIVYSHDRDRLVDVLGHLERTGLEPLRAEPDLCAWLHYLGQDPGYPPGTPAAVIGWAFGSLYLVLLDEQRRPILTRSMICASPAHAVELLGPELRRSTAPLPAERAPRKLLYHAGGFGQDQIRRFAELSGLATVALAEADLATALAAGAAIGGFSHERAVDFRADGLPPGSMLASRRRALFGSSAAICLLMCCLLGLLKLYGRQYQRQQDQAQTAANRAYVEVFGEPPGASADMTEIARKVRIEYRKLRILRRSHTQSSLPDSASRTFMLMMDALAGLGEDFDLKIDSLRCSPKDVRLAGSVVDLAKFEQMNSAIRRYPLLEAESWSFDQQIEDRREFDMSIRVVAASPDHPEREPRP
ncbi:MAG: hypothetical protein JW810_04250 [Sedimentisphaerales bacterium]|nr:hypothetical protein [Sedimentisphaerales bacterium]